MASDGIDLKPEEAFCMFLLGQVSSFSSSLDFRNVFLSIAMYYLIKDCCSAG